MFWDAPVRAFFWNEQLLKYWVESYMGIDWQEYVTSVGLEYFLQGITKSLGVLYIVCAVIVLSVKPAKHKGSKLLLIGASALLFLALLYYKEQFYRIGQLIEYTCQIAAPVFLFWIVRGKSITDRKVLFYMKLAIAFTFIGHGLYAVGYYPQPGHFVDMVIRIFHVSEAVARNILIVAGIMDFVLAVFIFVPRLAKPFLAYAFVWGFLTAMARVVAYFHVEAIADSLSQWAFETIYRMPHAGLPLLVLLMDNKQPIQWRSIFKRSSLKQAQEAVHENALTTPVE